MHRLRRPRARARDYKPGPSLRPEEGLRDLTPSGIGGREKEHAKWGRVAGQCMVERECVHRLRSNRNWQEHDRTVATAPPRGTKYEKKGVRYAIVTPA